MHIEILVKKIRKDKNLTLEQLSEKTGISRTHINDVENGLKEPRTFCHGKTGKSFGCTNCRIV